MADVRPLKIASGKRKRFVAGDTVGVSNGGTGLSTIAASKLLGSSTLDTYTTYAIPLTVGNGGTGADLSATGGTGQFLKQASAGAAVTVTTVTLSDLAAGTLAVTLTFGSSGTAANSRSITGIAAGVSYDTVTATSLQMRVNATRIGAFGMNVSGTQADTSWHIGGSATNYISNTAATGILSNVLTGNYTQFQVAGTQILGLGRNVSGTQANTTWVIGGLSTNYLNNTAGTAITGNVLTGNYWRFHVNSAALIHAGNNASGTVNDNNWGLGQVANGYFQYAHASNLISSNVLTSGSQQHQVAGARLLGLGTNASGTAGDNNWHLGQVANAYFQYAHASLQIQAGVITAGSMIWGTAGTTRLRIGANVAGTQADASWGIGTNGGTYISNASDVMTLATSGTVMATVDTQIKFTTGKNVVHGTAAIATSATDGFLYLPTCAGTPSGVPTANTGTCAFVYDTTNNKLYVYNGAWKATAALT